ncbi:copper homeostasis protein CutC [Lactobacillus sp. ESL0681]|uniref:copper homeostasis protein CutC n=1 Tax=Lactobacillus sp. ESL0681 TaxID=2983211 RepID=UPI0023F6FB4F|nr:copper homeostasis protein CutC [Lactobacillus sp. ESL0681]WEV40765.1 copper homeostasis protein CutC [Lactobacillus sp. ESL0681]
MIKEVCVENFTDIPRMIAAGADRIELNNNLAVGGTTPSFGVLQQAVLYAHNFNIPVVVMIRPRGGDFNYNEHEIAMMVTDIQLAALIGADAVTFGCLNAEKTIAKPIMKRMIELARTSGLEVVMHMAFDEIPENLQEQSLNWLADQGVKRILTHGGRLNIPITVTVAHLHEIITWATEKIEILPGGGITSTNAQEIAATLKVEQLHGSKIVLPK